MTDKDSQKSSEKRGANRKTERTSGVRERDGEILKVSAVLIAQFVPWRAPVTKNNLRESGQERKVGMQKNSDDVRQI